MPVLHLSVESGVNFYGLEKHIKEMDHADTGLGGRPSINLLSFTGKRESPYDFPFTQNNLQVLQSRLSCILSASSHSANTKAEIPRITRLPADIHGTSPHQ
jgi:hypothetical protein